MHPEVVQAPKTYKLVQCDTATDGFTVCGGCVKPTQAKLNMYIPFQVFGVCYVEVFQKKFKGCTRFLSGAISLICLNTMFLS